MKKSSISDCRVIDLPHKQDERGGLSFIEGRVQIPFAIERIFYMYDIPQNQIRGAHAHRELQQFLICAHGSFTVEVDDGKSKMEFKINRPSQGIYIPAGIWTVVKNLSVGAVCLVLASQRFNEADYVRDYQAFKALQA